MARHFFGYGRWDAPYWFIGPEQGGGDNPERAAAFSMLQKEKSTPDGLCDCLEFHRVIGENRWHFKAPVDLQWTWKRLMLLLMSFLGRPTENMNLCEYQRGCWGRACGESCVIDLSGLSFKCFRDSGDFYREAGHNPAVSWRNIRVDRVKSIRDKIRDVKPSLVVLYGYSHWRYWREIAGNDLPARGAAKRAGNTVFVLGPHPAAYGTEIDNSDLTWEALGKAARRATREVNQ